MKDKEKQWVMQSQWLWDLDLLYRSSSQFEEKLEGLAAILIVHFDSLWREELPYWEQRGSNISGLLAAITIQSHSSITFPTV